MHIPEEIIERSRKFVEPYRICSGKGFKLKDYPANDLGNLTKDHKDFMVARLEQGVSFLEELQSVLYASQSYALLVILQAMDAAGKDGLVKHVMGGINPQGCHVASFKQPTSQEYLHDYLWRCTKELPARGMIGIFNRSYYEEVLTAKVHPEGLLKEGYNPKEINKSFWDERYENINHYEKHLYDCKTRFVKIFLHVSYDEQRKRLLDRLDTPDKNWKFSQGDIHEREYWDDYQDAFETMIQRTATKEAPWYVIPADNKWYARIVGLCAVVNALADMKLEYPEVPKEIKEYFPKFRESLEKKK